MKQTLSTVLVSCTTSANLLNISAAIPKFPSLASPQSTTSVVTVAKDTKLKVKSFMQEVQFVSCKLNLKLGSRMSNTIFSTSFLAELRARLRRTRAEHHS